MLTTFLWNIRYLRDIFTVSKNYYRRHGKILNVLQPKRLTEKVALFKISRDAEKLSHLADKYEVRKYVAEKIGEKHLIPLLGVYDTVDDINLDALPNSFALKATHGCGWNIICKDKKQFDFEDAKRKLSDWMKRNYYKESVEIQYKNIKPRIISEEYIDDGIGELIDYKFHCFYGIPHAIRVIMGRNAVSKRSFYDLDWNKIPLEFVHEPRDLPADIQKPDNLAEMIDIATKLSQGHKYVRIDLYNAKGKAYFGEITLTPANALDIFYPLHIDEDWGETI